VSAWAARTVARDALSLGVNPAGLSQLDRPRFDGLAAVAYADTSHRDEFAGWVGNENKVLYLGNLGLAAPLAKLGLTLGAGLFAQAGSGVEYHNLETAFGTRDDLSSIFRIGKAALGAALKIDDRLSIGVSPVVFAADLEQRLFPDTSFVGAGASFFGLKVDGLKAFAAGAQVGALYRMTDRLALAVAYSTGSDLDLKDGSVRADFEAIGLGRVKYRDAEVDGFRVPQQASAGAAIQATDNLLLALELTWINWDSALNKVTLKAKKPNDPAAPRRLEVETDLDWRDQYVMAIGTAYQLSNEVTVRAGYNYANNPIPDATLNPVFPLTTQHHVTLGAGYGAGENWEINAALEYAIPSRVTYTNTQLPLGDKAQEDAQLLGLWMQVSYKW
jgi:long-chain fatty acid transport protein